MTRPDAPDGPGGPAGAPAQPSGDLAEAGRLAFALFHEVQILAQVSAALLAARLPEGVSTLQWGVLNHLARVRDGATPQQLARAFQVGPDAMAALLGDLEGRGLARRGGDRGRRALATEAGLRLRDRAMADLAPEVAALAARFPQGRMAALLPELAALRRVMDGMREG
jgi:DNA-binding MarR family transcriptional regulator